MAAELMRISIKFQVGSLQNNGLVANNNECIKTLEPE